MTEETKNLIISIIRRRQHDLMCFIKNQERSKLNVIKHPQYFDHPADEIISHNNKIKQYEERIKKLDKALKEIDQL